MSVTVRRSGWPRRSATSHTTSTHRAAIAVAVVLLACAPCYAHALSPLHYPLGPYPLEIPADASWFYALPGIVAAVLAAGAEILVLKALLRRTRWLGCVWRGFLLYAVARGVETGILLLPGFAGLGWSPYFSTVLLSVAILLGFGIAARVPLAKLLYRQSPIRWPRALLVAFASQMAGYTLHIAVFGVIEPTPFG